jgi:hypothetical protein
MAVLCGGKPAPITEVYRRILSTKDKPFVSFDGSIALSTIEPGRTHTFYMPLTRFFDLSAPGKYKVTFSRGTDPGQPDNVNVKSNTITITVLPAEAQ